MDLERAKNCVLRLLKYRPRSQKEIEEHLRRKKFPPQLIREVVGEFVNAGLIDDREFTKFWVNWRGEVNPKSKNFIRHELRLKGITEDLIVEALEKISEGDEFLKAKELAQKRYERLKNLEPLKKKQRLYAYLQRRGFNQEITWDVLNSLFKERELSV